MTITASRNIVVAVTGASGSIYAHQLLTQLYSIRSQWNKLALVFSTNGKAVCEYELGKDAFSQFDCPIYESDNLFVSFASGSAKFDTLIICPCSMGTLGRIAHGVSDNLITRCADVMLKERRQLILVTRETPLSLIHLENMRLITLAGGIILPASPSFYSKPSSIDELVQTVTHRIIDLAGFDMTMPRWNS